MPASLFSGSGSSSMKKMMMMMTMVVVAVVVVEGTNKRDRNEVTVFSPKTWRK